MYRALLEVNKECLFAVKSCEEVLLVVKTQYPHFSIIHPSHTSFLNYKKIQQLPALWSVYLVQSYTLPSFSTSSLAVLAKPPTAITFGVPTGGVCLSNLKQDSRLDLFRKTLRTLGTGNGSFPPLPVLVRPRFSLNI